MFLFPGISLRAVLRALSIFYFLSAPGETPLLYAHLVPSTAPTPAFPKLLSQTGLFTDTARHQVDPALIPYDVNAPLWSDNAKKQRFIGALTFEHPFVNVGVDYIKAKDQTLLTAAEIEAKGWSAWVTPRTPIGIEGLFRYDELKPDDRNDSKKKRTIAGIAYWFTVFKPGVATALLADYENVKYERFTPARPKEKRYALHMLVNF